MKCFILTYSTKTLAPLPSSADISSLGEDFSDEDVLADASPTKRSRPDDYVP